MITVSPDGILLPFVLTAGENYLVRLSMGHTNPADSQNLVGGNSSGRLWIWQMRNAWNLTDNQ